MSKKQPNIGRKADAVKQLPTASATEKRVRVKSSHGKEKVEVVSLSPETSAFIVTRQLVKVPARNKKTGKNTDLGIVLPGREKTTSENHRREARNIADLELEEISVLANQGWDDAAQQALDKGLAVLEFRNGRLCKHFADGHEEDLGDMASALGISGEKAKLSPR